VNEWNRLPGRPGLALDAGLAAIFLAALAVGSYRIAAKGGNWPFDAAVGAVVCGAALLGRHIPRRSRTLPRHWPWRGRGQPGDAQRRLLRATAIGLLVAGLAIPVARFGHLPGQPGVAAVAGLLVLVGSSARTLPRWSAAAVAAAGVAVVVVGRLAAAPAATGVLPAPTQLSATAWTLTLGIGLGLRVSDAWRRAAADAVRREERLDMAHELHDVVAHHITGIVLQTQAARIIARRRSAEAADGSAPSDDSLDQALVAIEAAGADALTAMRRVVGILRDAADGATSAPGPERLSDLVARFARHGPAIRLDVPLEEARWPPEVTSTVYRVVQESLTNIARHAPHAASASVSVAQEDATVTVEITDDAPHGSFRSPHRGGYGLIGMRERVETLGGTLRAGPRADDRGWSVCASLPVPVPTAAQGAAGYRNR
jgi:signal transduction histidine kinase